MDTAQETELSLIKSYIAQKNRWCYMFRVYNSSRIHNIQSPYRYSCSDAAHNAAQAYCDTSDIKDVLKIRISLYFITN